MTASSGCQASAAVFAEFKVKRILMFACNGMKISLNTSGFLFRWEEKTCTIVQSLSMHLNNFLLRTVHCAY